LIHGAFALMDRHGSGHNSNSVGVVVNGVGGFVGEDGGKGFGGGVLDVAEGAEVSEEALAGERQCGMRKESGKIGVDAEGFGDIAEALVAGPEQRWRTEK